MEGGITSRIFTPTIRSMSLFMGLIRLRQYQVFFQKDNVDWSRPGRNFIKRSCCWTGNDCKLDESQNRLNRSSEKAMKHSIYKIRSFKKSGPYTLEISFDDKCKRTIDFQPVLGGDLYGPLKDPEFFNRVRLDREVHTLIWPNGADFDPATLHDWSKHRHAFALAAKRWESARR